MRATRTVQKILANYEADNPGVKANICRLLMQGKLGGTGKLIILPVDQGFETRTGPVLRSEPGCLRPPLPLPARHRCGPLGLCRPARHARSRR